MVMFKVAFAVESGCDGVEVRTFGSALKGAQAEGAAGRAQTLAP